MPGRIESRCCWALLFIAVSAVGCGSDDSGTPPTAIAKGRGTAVCNKWQSSVYSFIARCNSKMAPTYQEQAPAITCISDDKAQQCATSLDSATCEGPPSGCDLVDLADRAPAQAACQQYLDASCAATVRCDSSTTTEKCLEQAKTKVDCTKAIGYKLAFEQCLSELNALACTATTTPASCKGVLLLGG